MSLLGDLRLPPGSRVVHIGPHKTGTTAVQFAFHAAREAVGAQGVHYAGNTSQAYLPALGLTGRRGRIGGPVATGEHWQQLVQECRDAGDQTVVISSESFANAAPADIERLADDLGRDRVQIVRMMRRYDAMLPSQWQQQVSGGAVKSYAAYLDAALDDPGHKFWMRHGFVALTRTWAEVVGPDRVCAVAVDESDREWLLRVFEGLVGLATGTLALVTSRANRSLTWGEVELVRAMNLIRRTEAWVDEAHFEFIRRGISPALRTSPPDTGAGRLTVPPAVTARLEEVTARDVAALTRLGVRIVGDPQWLHPVSDRSADLPSVPSIGLDSAVAAVDAVVARARTIEPFELSERTPTPRTGRDGTLTPDEQTLVSRLAERWSELERVRFLDHGLVPWLSEAPASADERPPGRLDPARVAAAVSGVVAATDPRLP